MKQTAVEWLLFELSKNGLLPNGILSDIHNQAKEMEKEQKIDFARLCLNKAKDLDVLTSFMNVEQYYNETFKSE
jgi:hypothetical protein